jgi:hypothetical protein
MDVHAPHQPVHTWRDFAIHLTIVTIGLFIALSLEAFVEYMHHRHLVREARENIRQELQDNHEAAQKNLDYLQKGIDQMRSNITTLHKMQKDPDSRGYSLTNSMQFSSLNDAAWRTARDTGALSYMPYSEVQRYADIYTLEDRVNKNAVAAGEHSYHSLAVMYMGYDKLPDAEYINIERIDATTILELSVLQQYIHQLDDQFLKELKK